MKSFSLKPLNYLFIYYFIFSFSSSFFKWFIYLFMYYVLIYFKFLICSLSCTTNKAALMNRLTWAEAEKIILFCNLSGFLSITLIAGYVAVDWSKFWVAQILSLWPMGWPIRMSIVSFGVCPSMIEWHLVENVGEDLWEWCPEKKNLSRKSWAKKNYWRASQSFFKPAAAEDGPSTRGSSLSHTLEGAEEAQAHRWM